MTKKQMKQVIFMGVGCVILLIAGIIYSLLFNDARWVKNMDMSNYVFSIKDIPMLIVGALIAIYVLYVTVLKILKTKTIQEQYLHIGDCVEYLDF